MPAVVPSAWRLRGFDTRQAGGLLRITTSYCLRRYCYAQLKVVWYVLVALSVPSHFKDIIGLGSEFIGLGSECDHKGEIEEIVQDYIFVVLQE